MRIIDKRFHDVYDYLQDPTDNLVFDRSAAFVLEKDTILLSLRNMYHPKDAQFCLIQCGVQYWLILITSNNAFKSDKFNTDLIATWKNYDRPRKLIGVDFVHFFYAATSMKTDSISEYVEWSKKNANMFIDMINRNDFNYNNNFDHITTYKYIRVKSMPRTVVDKVYDVPILKSSGLVSVIDPSEMFYAIEEYFSLEKSDAERTEAIGTTNNDKITSHGFDLKRSFRGK